MSLQVGIVMGSDSDLDVMKEAAKILEDFKILHELRIVSAHRTPEDVATYGKEALSRGLQILIAGAGGAAHLPGQLASYTPLPVIGVPIITKAFNGYDSLLSILPMPFGTPVATVSPNQAGNAALLAARILGATNPAIQVMVQNHMAMLANTSREKDQRLQEEGYENYLKNMPLFG